MAITIFYNNMEADLKSETKNPDVVTQHFKPYLNRMQKSAEYQGFNFLITEDFSNPSVTYETDYSREEEWMIENFNFWAWVTSKNRSNKVTANDLEHAVLDLLTIEEAAKKLGNRARVPLKLAQEALAHEESRLIEQHPAYKRAREFIDKMRSLS